MPATAPLVFPAPPDYRCADCRFAVAGPGPAWLTDLLPVCDGSRNEFTRARCYWRELSERAYEAALDEEAPDVQA